MSTQPTPAELEAARLIAAKLLSPAYYWSKNPDAVGFVARIIAAHRAPTVEFNPAQDDLNTLQELMRLQENRLKAQREIIEFQRRAILTAAKALEPEIER